MKRYSGQSPFSEFWSAKRRAEFRKKGFEMAPDGSKVIPVSRKRQCRCDGDCAHCGCAAKEKNEMEIDKISFLA